MYKLIHLLNKYNSKNTNSIFVYKHWMSKSYSLSVITLTIYNVSRGTMFLPGGAEPSVLPLPPAWL